jgi:hypothetical protein
VVAPYLFLLDAALLGYAGRSLGAGFVAWLLGVPVVVSTHGVGMALNLDISPVHVLLINEASVAVSVLVAIAGGVTLRHATSPSVRLFARYVIAVGGVAVAGDLFAAAIGTLDGIAVALTLPPHLPRIAVIAPLAIVVGILWRTGIALQPWRTRLVLPMLFVALAAPLIAWPLDLRGVLYLWAGQAPFAIVVTAAVWTGSRATTPAPATPLRIAGSAWSLLVLLVVTIRLMALGIPIGWTL